MEDRKIIRRAILHRSAETLLLIVSIGIGIGAATIGFNLFAQAQEDVRRSLQDPELRTIGVFSDGYSEDIPVFRDQDNSVNLSSIDLDARDEAPDVDYAFVRNWSGLNLFNEGTFENTVETFKYEEDLDLDAEVDIDVISETEKIFGKLSEDLLAGPLPVVEWIPTMQVTPEFFTFMELEIAEGSLFTEAETDGENRYLVLGSEAAQTLFADGQSLGRKVQTWNEDKGIFTIIGILRPSSSTRGELNTFGFTQAPNLAYQEQLRALLEKGELDWLPPTSIVFGVDDSAKLDSAKNQLKSWFDRKYGEGRVYIDIPREGLEATRVQYTRPPTIIFFLALAGLFMMSINVSNILLSRSLRRHKTVGILMALGSTRRNIFALFFTETLIITIIGAVLGLVASIIILPAMENRIMDIAGNWLIYLFIGFILSWLITMVLTVFPAIQAARLPAAEAMRNE